jgi:8-oxo-dGTP pyrophosphatase MutT (NUDIX family)
MRTVVPSGARLVPSNAKRVFEGVIYDVYHWPQELFDGSVATFEILKRQDSVKVIAVKDGAIIILDDEQPTHERSIALPGGRHDIDSETELQCAKRELLEETGLSFKNWKLIGVKQLNIEIDWLTYVFLADGFEGQKPAHADGGERIAVRELSYAEVTALPADYPTLQYAQGIIRQAGSLEGLLTLPAVQ